MQGGRSLNSGRIMRLQEKRLVRSMPKPGCNGGSLSLTKLHAFGRRFATRMSEMGKFTKLDSLIVSCLRDAIPGFQDPPLEAVSQQVDASTIRSHVRLRRPRGDRLIETILFHRTSQARHGFFLAWSLFLATSSFRCS